MSDPLTPQLHRRLNREIKRLSYEVRIASNQVPMLRAMVDGSPDALAILDKTGLIIEHNSKLTQIHGSGGMLHGVSVRTLFYQQKAKRHDTAKNWSLLSSETLEEATMGPVRLHGYCNDRPVEVDLSPVNEFVAMSVRLLDDVGAQARELQQARMQVSELDLQLRQEREIQRVTRLESLAMLSGTLAHDLNNALAIVTGNLEILREEIENDAHHELLDDISMGSRAVRELADRLRTFSKGPSLLLSPLELTTWLRAFLKPIAKSLHVEIGLFLPDESCWIAADEGQFGQVMLNLLTNASQAAGDSRGVVEISLQRIEPDEADGLVEHAVLVTQAPHYLLRVHDNGPGIPDEILPTIFEPFFTTKPRGTGLGLASVSAILTAHKGSITAGNDDAGGAVFSIVIPCCPSRRLPQAPDAADPTAQSLEGCSILLLEDQARVRQVMRKHFKSAGARVHAVATSQEAEEEYTRMRASGVIPLCVFDLLLQGEIGGAETLQVLRQDWPDITALACSGHAEVDMAEVYSSFGFRSYIAKPFTRAGLIEAVAEVFRGMDAIRQS